MRYEHIWDADTGTATCRIYDKNNVFEGVAHCHEQDADFMSERTGCYIAECRAGIARLRHIRDNDLRPQLKALKHFYYTLSHRKTFNIENHAIKCLLAQIEMVARDLEEVKQDIKLEQQYLSDYIKNKEIMYQKVRKAKAQ